MTDLLGKSSPAPSVLGKFTKLAEKITAKREKISSQAAGYMELEGAKKDGDCRIVQVDGGISKERGCCNLFLHKDGKSLEFRCGTCHFED